MNLITNAFICLRIHITYMNNCSYVIPICQLILVRLALPSFHSSLFTGQKDKYRETTSISRDAGRIYILIKKKSKNLLTLPWHRERVSP